MNISELKEKLLQSIELWADSRIDDMVQGNPKLAVPSVYMKRAAHNIIAKNKEMLSRNIDNVALFIADEEGNMNVETVFNDMVQIFKSLEPMPYDLGVFGGTVGNGALTIDLPDNIVTSILFGSKKSIQFTTDDFAELKKLITE